MRPKRIVLGVRVKRVKVEAARELRQRMTLSERRMWQRLQAGRLDGYHFRRQQLIAGFIVDFYCHRAGLAIEIDGGVHEQQREYDSERDGLLESLGVRVVRFGNKDVLRRLEQVPAEIRHACAEGEARVSSARDDEESQDPGGAATGTAPTSPRGKGDIELPDGLSPPRPVERSI